ncbi:MAG: DUF5695 domain-containing protein [Fimbriimonas sp.]
MDDYRLDRQELNGSLISLEFGPGGRVMQLWASDPNAPDETEEFQFVAPPLNMGEELSDDYFPGTILLGARTSPDDPWMVSRNTRAELLEEDEETHSLLFQYDFPFLEDLRITGHWHEIPGPIPQIAWDVNITNRSRRVVEIGELGFPLALNNLYEGFPRTDDGVRELFQDRVYVHKFIGGAASYVFAQRMTSRPPGLLIFPGGETSWEFFHHVPASLHTPFRWEGIPVVYVHSRATIEREGWHEWFGDHTWAVLEPGDERNYSMRFAPADRDAIDGVGTTLAACGRPTMRLFPAAVAPYEVGIGVEIAGTTPARFETNVELDLETDADEEGGFCFVRPTEPGPVTLTFEDTQGRMSDAHLLFTEKIETLIQRRADYIVGHQIYTGTGALEGAILPTDITTGTPISEAEAYAIPFGVEASLADALFLAEKNAHYPDAIQIGVLDDYLEKFLEDDLQNPGDGSVGSMFGDLNAVAGNFGRPQVYPLVFSLYHSMARVAGTYGRTRHPAAEYLRRAGRAARALFAFGQPALMTGMGIPLMSYIPSLIADMDAAGLAEEATKVREVADRRARDLLKRRYPFAGEGLWSPSGFEEAFDVALRYRHHELQERSLRLAYAKRALAPSWWWYASDKRWIDDPDAGLGAAAQDKGELCLGPSSVADSILFFRTLAHDYAAIPEHTMRLAFGGMLGIWALVRADGGASMGFSPDEASRHFGMAAVTGDVGVGLFHYLRGVGSYVLPNRSSGLTTFGCHVEAETEAGGDVFVVRPWDGIGRRIVVRQVGLEVELGFGVIRELRFDARKRNAALTVENPADADQKATLRVRGLWGRRFAVAGKEIEGVEGELRVELELPAGATSRTEIAVIG